jgi:hypothetical protein
MNYIRMAMIGSSMPSLQSVRYSPLPMALSLKRKMKAFERKREGGREREREGERERGFGVSIVETKIPSFSYDKFNDILLYQWTSTLIASF